MAAVAGRSRLGAARIGVSLLFMANGAMWANVAPRLPEIRERLDVSYAQFGLAAGVGSLGGIVLGLAAAPTLRRLGSARAAALGLALQALALLGAVTAPTVWLFAAGLFLNSALDSVTDVAQNAQGLGIQQRLGRSIINGLHAMWSLGAAVGAALGSLALGAGLGVTQHGIIATAAFLAVALLGLRLMFGPGTGIDPEPDPDEQAGLVAPWRMPRTTVMIILALGFISLAGVGIEDAGFTWSSSYLGDELHATGTIAGFGVAGLGLAALMSLHFVGRLVGDRLVDRWGERAVARVGGSLTAVAMGVALLWPTVPGTIIGFALAGLGVATVVPAAYAAAHDVPGLRHGTGITLVSWVLRVSFLAGPPLVGAIADTWGLRIGLITMPLAGLAVVALAGNLKPAKRPVSPAGDTP